MRYKKGQSGNPNGRPRGAKDKIARSAKETIEKAVEQIGGVDELVAWAKKNNRNQEKLYDWYFSMLPKNTDVGIRAQVDHAIFMMPRPKKNKKNNVTD